MSDGVRLILRVHFIIHNFINIHIKGIFFRLLYNFRHYFDRFYRIFSHGAFSRKHNCGGSVKDRICYIRDFRSGWGRACYHGFQHLCGSNDNFASLAAGLDEFFLDSRKFCEIYLYSHVASGNHNSIRMIQNFSEVFNSFHILNFRYDFNLASAIFI